MSPEQSDHGGAGLGLPIAKGIVEAHGGRLWLETSGKGTSFYFTIPVASGQEEEDDSAVA